MVTVGTVIVLALYALMDTIISMLFNGAMWIARSIMDSSITIFAEDQNIISTFANLLPFSGGTEGVTVNVGSIIDGIAYGIITLVVVIGIIRSIAAPVTGEDTDSAFNVIARAVIAIVAKNLIFGFETDYLSWSFNGLLGVFGRWFGLILSSLGEFNYEKFTDINAWTLNAAAYIGALILMAALLGNVLGAAISYIERILSFALTVLVGPVAISLYAYRATQHIARQWIMSIFTQFGAIFLNLLLWGAFINQINSLEGLWVSSDGVGTLIFKLAIAITILSLIKNCEKIFNSFGLSTLANHDSARALAGGVATLGSGAAMAMRSAPMAKAAAFNGMHGKNPAQGGLRTSAFAKGVSSAYTGNSLYDKNGSLNSRGAGNSAANSMRGVVARSAGNFTSPIMGRDSTRSMQNRQLAAQSAIRGAVQEAKEGATAANRPAANGGTMSAAGMRVGSSRISDSSLENNRAQKGLPTDSKMYSGVQLANMAISGREDGTARGFSFAPSGKSPMGSLVSDSEGIGTLGSFEGAYHDAAGSGVSSGLVIGTSETPLGGSVTGVIGNGRYEGSDGRIQSLGPCFMPVEGGGEENLLGIGQSVCVGYDENGYENNMYVSQAVRIGDDGAFAYTLVEKKQGKSDVHYAASLDIDFSISDENVDKEAVPSEDDIKPAKED